MCELLTMNEGAIEPLNVIVFGEGEEDLIANDRERQEEDGTTWHCQGEGAQVQSAKGTTDRLSKVLIHTVKKIKYMNKQKTTMLVKRGILVWQIVFSNC